MAEAPGMPQGRLGDPPARRDQAEIRRWVEGLREGTDREESFRQLFRVYYRPLCGFFARRRMTRDDCLDLTQETFLRILNNIGQFRFEAPFESWLFEVAVNVWRNELRHRGAGKRKADEVPLGDKGEPPPVGAAGCEAEDTLRDLLAEERARVLRQVLDELPPRMRNCVLLVLDQDLSYPEVAAVMRISVDAVKSHMHQARQKLREKLSGYFEEVGL